MRLQQTYVFDYDGTLCAPFTSEPLSGVRERIVSLGPVPIGVVTNQAGPVFRAMGQGRKYPLPDTLVGQLLQGIAACGLSRVSLFICVAAPSEQQALPGWQEAATTVRAEVDRALNRMRSPLVTDWIVSAFREDRKPHPGGIIRCLHAMGVKSERAVYVGDRSDDAQAAARASVGFLDAAQWREGR